MAKIMHEGAIDNLALEDRGSIFEEQIKQYASSL